MCLSSRAAQRALLPQGIDAHSHIALHSKGVPRKDTSQPSSSVVDPSVLSALANIYDLPTQKDGSGKTEEDPNTVVSACGNGSMHGPMQLGMIPADAIAGVRILSLRCISWNWHISERSSILCGLDSRRKRRGVRRPGTTPAAIPSSFHRMRVRPLTTPNIPSFP